MNKIIKVKQYSTLCHADDLKMLHVDYDIVSGILSEIYSDYGNIAKMTITRGKIHKYLWMTIE